MPELETLNTTGAETTTETTATETTEKTSYTKEEVEALLQREGDRRVSEA